MTLNTNNPLEGNAPGKQGAASQDSEGNSGESARSNPVCLELSVTIRSLPSGAGGVGKPIREEVRTVIVFDNGAVLRCSENLPVGLSIILSNHSGRDVVCRVVGGRSLPNVKGYVEVQFIEAVSDFWNVHQESAPVAPAPIAAVPPIVAALPPIVSPLRSEPAAPPRPPAPARAAVIPEAPAKPASKSQGGAPSFDDIGGLTSTPVSTTPRNSKASPARPSPELAAQDAGYSHAETAKPTSLANWNLSELDSPTTKDLSATISSTSSTDAPAPSRDFMSKGLMAYEKPSSSSSSASGRMPLIVGAAVLALAAVGGVVFFMHRSPAPASVAQTSAPSQLPESAPPPSSSAPESTGAAQVPAAQEAVGAQPSAQPIAVEQAQPVGAITATPAVVTSPASNDSRADQQKVRLSEKNAVAARQVEPSAVRRPAMPNLKMSSPSAPSRKNSDSNGGAAPSMDIAMVEPAGTVPSAGLLTSAGRTSSAPLPPPSALAPAASTPAPTAAIAKTVREPKLISSSRVAYPTSAKQANIQGSVTLSLTIDERGNVIGAKALNGPLLLRQAAADSVKLWKYSPGLLDGKPAPSQVTVSVDFKLN